MTSRAAVVYAHKNETIDVITSKQQVTSSGLNNLSAVFDPLGVSAPTREVLIDVAGCISSRTKIRYIAMYFPYKAAGTRAGTVLLIAS